MEKIIITGTKGFIGSNLKKELEGKYEIIEINEDIFQNISWKEEVSKHFWLDIKGVFHVGACSDTLETNVNYMMLVNYEFTKHITNLCESKNIPIIYSSSDEIGEGEHKILNYIKYYLFHIYHYN